jgi:hypothetical protein
MRQYNTGVFAEPFSIAGIASLFRHQHVLKQVRAAGHCSSKAELYRVLSNYRYGLDSYIDETGRMRYGFVPLYQLPHGPEATYYVNGDPDPGAFNGTNARIYRNSQWRYPHRASSLGLICLLLVLLIVVVYYKLTDYDSTFEHFMDSQGFGVRFLFTSIGVLIKLYWNKIFGGNNIKPPMLKPLSGPAAL